MRKNYDELWSDLERAPFGRVQNRNELRWMYERCLGAKSYLEIGTSFGGSLHVIGNALADMAMVVCIDMPKGRPERDEQNLKSIQAVSNALGAKLGHRIALLYADSHRPEVIAGAAEQGPYDVVLIDGDHSEAGVRQDWEGYGQLGKRVFFHDVSCTGAKQVFDEIDAYKELIEEEYGMGVVYNCRHCYSPTRLLVDLGQQPVANNLLESPREETTYPLAVVYCDNCGLAQLAHFVEPGELFGPDYVYASSYSYTGHWREYADEINRRFSPETVIEVGSNDGYLLKHFDCERIGVDPAVALAPDDYETMPVFFSYEMAEVWLPEKADVLLANNVLAHTPDIDNFIKGVRIALKPDGVAVFEFPWFKEMLFWTQYDTIYHEHYSYLSLKAVDHILQSEDMRAFDVEKVNVHGGSLRVYADKGIRPVTAAVAQTKAEEQKMRPEEFAARVVESKRNTLLKILDRKGRGLRVVGFGAAAKAITRLNYCGIGKEFIEYIVDDNPLKQGKLTPGAGIPIYSVEKLKEDRPQCVVILPWNLEEQIKERLSFIKEWGGEFCVL